MDRRGIHESSGYIQHPALNIIDLPHHGVPYSAAGHGHPIMSNSHLWKSLYGQPERAYQALHLQQLREALYPHDTIPLDENIAELSYSKDKFEVKLDVRSFKAEELTVKVVEEGGWVIVDGHHPEKEDEHGFISRHFVRRYKLPEGVTDADLVVDLSVDGILQLRVPAKFLAEGDGNGKVLPINLTGRLATAARSPLAKDQGSKHDFYGPAPKREEGGKKLEGMVCELHHGDTK